MTLRSTMSHDLHKKRNSKKTNFFKQFGSFSPPFQ